MASIDGARFSSQFNGLGDGRERFCNGLNRDLATSTVETCPDPCSKGCEEDDAFKFGRIVEQWAFLPGPAVCLPVAPILASIPFSRRSDAMLDASLRTHDITREKSSGGTWICTDYTRSKEAQ